MMRRIFGILSFLIAATHSGLSWSECSPKQSEMEIIPTSCSYRDPYEYEIWQYGQDGEKIVTNDLVEKVEALPLRKNRRKALLEQYYGAVITMIDEEEAKKILGMINSNKGSRVSV